MDLATLSPLKSPRRAAELQGRLLFAIPKKGRLYDKITSLLDDINFKYKRKARLDVAVCTNLNIALVFLPAADIALFVAKGRVHLGITGQDIVAESETHEHVIEEIQLGFGNCRLSVQAPVDGPFTSSEDLIGKRIVTSFTNLSSAHFRKLDPDVETSVTYVSGSVEAACSLGLADAIVDLVESGDTMRAAGLHEVDVIMKTQAVLISNRAMAAEHTDMVAMIKQRIKGVLTAQSYVYLMYNITRSKLDEAKSITPGMKAPTVSLLEDEEFCAVSVMEHKSTLHDRMDALEALGAEDIIVLQPSHCR